MENFYEHITVVNRCSSKLDMNFKLAVMETTRNYVVAIIKIKESYSTRTRKNTGNRKLSSIIFAILCINAPAIVKLFQA